MSSLSFSERLKYLKEFGVHSQSFSTLQRGMQYFDIPGIGYIGYMNYWRHIFVLCNPVCDEANYELMLERFHQRFPNASYVQVSKPVVDILHQNFGLYGTQLGSEARIDLTNWSLSGKKKQVVRTAINQARKQGITVEERFTDARTRCISETWIRTRKCKDSEMRFLVRPLTMAYAENARHFYAYQDGRALGFIFFDPVYDRNRIVSYVPNISRACSDFRQGIFYTIMAHAIDVFRTEGVPFLDLGLIPLMISPDDEGQESRLLKRLMRTIYEKGNFLYSFKGLEFTKSRFRGDLEKTYCCHKHALPLLAFFALFKLTHLL